jgi:hypothetical protein
LHIALKCFASHSLPPFPRRSQIPSVHTFTGRI